MTYQPPQPQPQPPLAPIPVAPLEWPAPPPPPRRGRPGIITAMGVMSIVVACTSGMANFVITFLAFGMLVGSRNTPAMIVPPMPPAGQVGPAGQVNPSVPGATAIVGGVAVDPAQSEDGVGDDQRPMVIAGMTRARSLDAARTKQLDLLLRVAGRSMFPFISPGTTPQTIRANVSESGRLPSASAGKRGPDYFIIGTGRVEVYDGHAIFRPDGSPNVVSVAAPADDGAANDPNAQPPPPPPPPSLPPIQPPPVTPVPNPMASVNGTAAALSMLEGILSLALAIYLLIVGILTLRDSRGGRRLHAWYVGLKIALVVLAVAAHGWLATSMISGFAAAANAAAANTARGAPPAAQTAAAGVGAVIIFWVVLLAIAALAYPLALIPVLLSKTVRQYYAPARDD